MIVASKKIPVPLKIGNWLTGNWVNNYQLPITNHQLPT